MSDNGNTVTNSNNHTNGRTARRRGGGGDRGGILRTRRGHTSHTPSVAPSQPQPPPRRGVTFSSTFQSRVIDAPYNRHDEDDDDDDDDDDDGGYLDDTTLTASRNAIGRTTHEDDYDSDEVEDAILASGDALSMPGGTFSTKKRASRDRDDDDDGIDEDAAAVVKSLTEIEQAKRLRGKARRREIEITNEDKDYFDDDDDDDDHGDMLGKTSVHTPKHNDKSSSSSQRQSQSLSLIENQDADPDAYESNAGDNAECPVEPFNMNAEQESGLGYFDGDTYVFRQNAGGKKKRAGVGEEEDAWLDGLEGEGEEVDGDGARGEGIGGNSRKRSAVGGLDSTSIWKPENADGTSSSISSARFSKKGGNAKKKAKYITEDATDEDIGRRIATLLESGDDTVMAALTRHGATLRELQAKEAKLSKKQKLKPGKRKIQKVSIGNDGVEGSDDNADGASNANAEDSNSAAAPTTETVQAAAPTTFDALATATTKIIATTAKEELSQKEMHQIKIKIQQTRETVEELTELADALLFGGETDAYDLTKRDWIHRFKLECHFPTETTKTLTNDADLKRALDNGDGTEGSGLTDGDHEAKKPRRGYFDDTPGSDANANAESSQDTNAPDVPAPSGNKNIMWEYRGNEDGAIHGPFTSRQMMEWVSCGYFVGASAVDIRRVGSMGSGGGEIDALGRAEERNGDAKTDVDDLMADLLDDDDDDNGNNLNVNGDEGETDRKDEKKWAWVRSDEVDFGSYL